MQFYMAISAEHRPGDSMHEKIGEHVEQVRLAHRAGFDGVTIGNHLPYGSAAWFPPFETLIRLAPEAGDMSLATCMLILPLYHPLQVAQQVALLDAACGGRFIFGVSPGWQQDEFRVMGVDFNKRIGRYLEGVELIRRLFTEERVDFEGRHFQAKGLSLALQPVRRPRPPMWFGASVAAAIERAARLADTALGDSWVASVHLTLPVIVEQARLFKNTLATLGKPMPRDLPLVRNIVVAPDRKTALREAGPFIEASYRVLGKWGLFKNVNGSGAAQPDFEDLIAGRLIIGSPEECAEELVRLAEATGFTRLVARIQWWGMDQRIVLRTIELLGERVLPLVRRALGPSAA